MHVTLTPELSVVAGLATSITATAASEVAAESIAPAFQLDTVAIIPETTAEELRRLKKMALNARSKGRLGEAIARFEGLMRREIELSGTPDPMSPFHAGLAFRDAGRFEQALEAFRWSNKLCEHPRTWYEIAATHRRAHQYPEALEAIDTAIRLEKGGMPLSFSEKALILRGTQRFEEALASIEKAINLVAAPSGGYLAQKAAILMEMGRHRAALSVVFRGIELNDKWLDRALGVQAQIYLGMGRLDEALVAIDRALDLSKNARYGYYHYVRAQILEALGFFEDAVEALNQAILLENGSQSHSFRLKAKLLRKLRAFGTALLAIERAITLVPIDGGNHFEKALILKEMGRVEEALAAIDEAIRLHPTATKLGEKAKILAGLGRLDEALAAIEAALKQDPTRDEFLREKEAILRAKQLF